MHGRFGRRGRAECVIGVVEEIHGVVRKEEIISMAGCGRDLEGGLGEVADGRSVQEVRDMSETQFAHGRSEHSTRKATVLDGVRRGELCVLPSGVY